MAVTKARVASELLASIPTVIDPLLWEPRAWTKRAGCGRRATRWRSILEKQPWWRASFELMWRDYRLSASCGY
jgi:hypothetical protein